MVRVTPRTKGRSVDRQGARREGFDSTGDLVPTDSSVWTTTNVSLSQTRRYPSLRVGLYTEQQKVVFGRGDGGTHTIQGLPTSLVTLGPQDPRDFQFP